MQPRRKKKPLARFLVVRAETARLDRKTLRTIVRSALPIVRGESYTSFIAIAEDDGTPSDTGKADLEEIRWPEYGKEGLPIHGRVRRDSLTGAVRRVLRKKYADEVLHRDPRHKSYVAPSTLTPEKVIVVIGSMPFLARQIVLYLERTGILKEKTFDYLIDVMCLVPWQGSVDDRNCFVDCSIEDEDAPFFYPGNFNVYAEVLGLAHGTFTTEELEALLDDDPP